MKNIIKYLKDILSLVSNVKQLENDVENLENKVLAPEDAENKSGFSACYSWFSSWSFGGGKIREMTLEEKVDAIAKVLKIEFTWKEEQDKRLVAKIKKPRKKTK